MKRKEISFVKKKSLADFAGIEANDMLLSVNGKDFQDIIDLSFLFAEEYLELEVLTKTGNKKLFIIEKDIDDDVGLEFSQAVFDAVRTCQNKCLFCFVDQMAPQMRETLYVKDDDYRLSFLSGNFITLTNLQKEDKERILKLKLSPLYVSVHATDGDVRRYLIKHKKAVEILDNLRELGAGGIKFHTQLVLCPGINDGSVLEKSYHELLALHEIVLSVSVVPIGLTKFCREPSMRPFQKHEAQKVIEQVARWQEECRRILGRSFIYTADEFYIQAGVDFPAEEYYDGYRQYENGIGICRKFIDEWQQTNINTVLKEDWQVICGKSASYVLSKLFNQEMLLTVENDFFGQMVTVTGLLTGRDILHAVEQLEHKPKCIIIPGVALKNKDEHVFLDDMTLQELKEQLTCDIKVAYTAAELKKLLAG